MLLLCERVESEEKGFGLSKFSRPLARIRSPFVLAQTILKVLQQADLYELTSNP